MSTKGKAKSTARQELIEAFQRGAVRWTNEKAFEKLQEKAFDNTLGHAIDEKGDPYWSGKPRDFALANAEAIGRVAAVLASVAGRYEVNGTDFAKAADLVVHYAGDLCKPLGTGGDLEARGIQCENWEDLAKPLSTPQQGGKRR